MPFLFNNKSRTFPHSERALDKNLVLLAILLAVFVFGAILGFELGQNQLPPEPIKGVVNQELGQPENVDFSLFWDTWRTLQQKYPQSLNPQEMVYGAIQGMVKSLQDPYTIFFKPQDAQRFQEDIEGQFEGVGMEIGIRKNQLQVIAPLEGTPAKEAGLRPEDKITKIDGKDTFDMTLDEAVNLIKGPRGTQVVLTIMREDWAEPKDITITRAVIQIPMLNWEIKEGNIAYIKFYQFSRKAQNDFATAANEILNSPAEVIILDLRNNPGGFLDVAQKIAGWFLRRGDIVTIEEFSGGEQKLYKSEGPSRLIVYPVVVLINQGSASASEILAGALRDNRGIKIIGEKSFGKGSIQEVVNLKDSSVLKITVANWLTPKGQLIEGLGLEPDIRVEMTDEDYAEGRDPQLERAIEVAKQLTIDN